MIRPAPSRTQTAADTPPGVCTPRIPDWLRRAAKAPAFPNTEFAAGAALGALDMLVRGDMAAAQAWRCRLALRAAAISCQRVRRPEDETALRDALALTRPGDDVGPAGRILLAWRMLVSRPAGTLSGEDTLRAMVEACGYGAEGRIADLREMMLEAGEEGHDAIAAAERLFLSVRRLFPEFETVIAPLLCDAVVARALGWSHAVPLFLLAGEASASQAVPSMLRAMIARRYARAALDAVDLAITLERRAGQLLQVAPKLRAKGAQPVVQAFLEDDAIGSSSHFPGMSDRGLRRLYTRLVSLGAVRELTGRDSFRIYGL
ncbi:DUF1403 family protein [Nitratireductor sp. OM-1]|uniref:DUF1403 family protein n=1 Tax=Nitratireductor sp. OM-1 TaxID=1756988 RepID=UPI000DDF847E|nr:DUF1403 family protein [Nitratireductor sp. OM-1]